MFLSFTKVAAVIHSSMDRVFLKRALAAMNCVNTMYLIDILKILGGNSSCSHSFDEWPFLYRKGIIATTHIFKFTMFLHNKSCSKEIS